MGMTHVPSTAGLTSQTRGSSHTHTAEHVSVPESSEGSEVSPRETKHTNRPSSGRSGRRLHARPGSAEKRLKHICLEEDIQENTDTLGSPPVVESCSSEDVTIQAGKPIQMSCMASGNPPPTITWRHNGQLISSEDSHYYIPAPGFLYISSAVESDCGFYTCSIINDFGNVSRCFYLNVTPDQAAAHKLSIPVDPSEDLLTSVGCELFPLIVHHHSESLIYGYSLTLCLFHHVVSVPSCFVCSIMLCPFHHVLSDPSCFV